MLKSSRALYFESSGQRQLVGRENRFLF